MKSGKELFIANALPDKEADRRGRRAAGEGEVERAVG